MKPEPWSLDVLEAARAKQPGGWLTPDGVGGPLPQDALRRVWARADIGDLPRAPFRNLRNSWRTIMRWELGVSEDILEKLMGHVGRGVSAAYYDRPRAEYFADVVSKAWLAHRGGK